MFGEIFANYTRCFKSYQAIPCEDDPPLAVGTVVRILKGDYPESLKIYVGCSAVVIGHSDDTPPLYKLREIATRAEICWLTDEQVMPIKSNGRP